MSLTEAETQAAAGVTDLILGDFVRKGGYEHLVQAEDAPAAEATPAPPVSSTPAVATNAAPAAPVAEATPVPPVPQVEAPEVPSFDAEVPDDLQALLDEPDFDEEAAAEVAARVEANPDEYIDTEATATELAKDKRIKFLEDQLVAKSRKGWVAENLRAYPLLRTYAKDEVEAIKATSRRGFAREAAALNGRLETIAKPMLADIQTLKESLKGEAITEGKAEAIARWGNVPGDVSAAGDSASNAADLAAAEKNAIKTGSMLDVFKVMLRPTPRG